MRGAARLHVARLQQVGIGGEIIDDLRHETAEVDGIGRGQHAALTVHFRRKRGIGENSLDAGLRVVKIAVHSDYMRVAAAGSHHLQTLRLRNAAVGIEHAAARARHIEEALQRRLAGVAAGRHEDEHLAFFAVLFAAHGQQIRQKLKRHVLKRQRRAMPELKAPRTGTHLHHRRNLGAVKPGAVSA